jgi:hypothetical protein
MLLKNTQIEQIIPEDCKLYKTNIIPFSLQPNKKNLKALAIGSSFSYIPTMLSSLPYVEHVTLLTKGKNIMPLTIDRVFSARPSHKLNIINMNINEYLKINKNKFDLIIWLSPNQSYLNFDVMLKRCAFSLSPNGALAVSASLLTTNNAQVSCKQIFKNKISIPGKSFVYAFSNRDLTSNLKVLEKRLEKFDTGEIKLFPPKTFSIIYSMTRQTSSHIVSSNQAGIENRLMRSFLSYKINFRHLLIIFVCTGLYFIWRFFILRRKSLYAATGLFENGLCLMMLMTILMSIMVIYK